jgi:crossover junction endodeoxyribonuclease RuvC
MRRTRASSWRHYQPEPANRPAANPRAVETKLTGIVRVLGLDPGSLKTGFGIIEIDGATLRHVTHGVIDVRGDELAPRLRQIHAEIAALAAPALPCLSLEVAIERAFMYRNADSALKLAQARGAALAALPEGAEVFEYAPRAIKQATVGYGAADKTQVANMVARLLGLVDGIAKADAADALAVALCHASARRLSQWVAAGQS